MAFCLLERAGYHSLPSRFHRRAGAGQMPDYPFFRWPPAGVGLPVRDAGGAGDRLAG